MASIPPRSEVRGLWFTTAQKYVLDTAGAEALEAMVMRVERQYKEILTSPQPNEWYPERALQQALAAMHFVVTGGNDARFITAMEECTIQGVNRFFRMFLRLGSPATLLRKTPAMWSHIRRGAGNVDVTAGNTDARIKFTDFPYFRDPNYRLLTLGAVRALVTMSGARDPVVEMHGADYDWMTVDVRY
jgi:hypothetical protein